VIDDEQHPAMRAAQDELMRRLAWLTEGKNLTGSLMHDVFDMVSCHRTEYRGKGVEFPALVAVVVPRLGIIELKRADLELPSIRTSIVNFVRAHPAASMQEVVEAFRRAYPDLKPDDVLEKHETGTQANQRAAEKRDKLNIEGEG
jgi:hypothetical protein